MVNAQNEKTRAAVLGEYQRACDGVASQLESPIEVAVFWALLAYGTEWGQPWVQDNAEHDTGSWFRIPTEFEDITFHPQAEVEANGRKYRLDFAAYVDASVGSHRTDARAVFRAAVECDGHDFHERTKEQAARDRKRDRDLQAAGYIVLRFTGSEIARDPEAVAGEIVKALNAKAYAVWSAEFDAHLAAQAASGKVEG